MSENNEKNNSGILTSFLLGSLVGAIVALLYTPKTGKEFREVLKKKGEELKDETLKFVSKPKQRKNKG